MTAAILSSVLVALAATEGHDAATAHEDQEAVPQNGSASERAAERPASESAPTRTPPSSSFFSGAGATASLSEYKFLRREERPEWVATMIQLIGAQAITWIGLRAGLEVGVNLENRVLPRLFGDGGPRNATFYGAMVGYLVTTAPAIFLSGHLVDRGGLLGTILGEVVGTLAAVLVMMLHPPLAIAYAAYTFPFVGAFIGNALPSPWDARRASATASTLSGESGAMTTVLRF